MAIPSRTTLCSTCWRLGELAAIVFFSVSSRVIRPSSTMQRTSSSKALALARSPMCTSKGARVWGALILLAGCALLLGACKQQMFQQPSYRPYQPSSLFADGTSARPLPADTVARGQLHDDPLLFTGKDASG